MARSSPRPDPAPEGRDGPARARVVAFDELVGFAPAPGPVARLDDVGPPEVGPSVRIADVHGATADTGVTAKPDGVPGGRLADLDGPSGGPAGSGRVADLATIVDGPAAGAASRTGVRKPARPRRSRGAGGAVSDRTGDDAASGDAGKSEADPESVARAICLHLLTERARTRQELAQALRRKGVPDDAAGRVLDRFDDVGLVDDGAFAAQWVHSRHANRGLGRRALAVELRRKGVADDVAGEALAGIDAAAEERRARELVERKLRALRVDSAEQRAVAARKLVGMLARKGYGGGMAYRVVREVLAAHGAELDEAAAESGC